MVGVGNTGAEGWENRSSFSLQAASTLYSILGVF
jgi:hypothetical protein